MTEPATGLVDGLQTLRARRPSSSSMAYGPYVCVVSSYDAVFHGSCFMVRLDRKESSSQEEQTEIVPSPQTKERRCMRVFLDSFSSRPAFDQKRNSAFCFQPEAKFGHRKYF